MFLEAITNEVELELLRLLGIELVDGKLINTETDETFVKQPTEEHFEHIYKCGKTIVKFIECNNPYVWVTKDGLTYCAGEQKKVREFYLGRFLYINSVADKVNDCDKGQGITIQPEVDRDFMETDIRFNNNHDNHTFRDRIIIKCDFDSIRVVTYDYNGSKEINCGEISKDTYKSILESSIKSSFKDEKIRNAYLKCMPFILNEFETLLFFPVNADILFREEVIDRLDRIDSDISSSIRYFLKRRDYALERLDKTDKTEEQIKLEQNKIYVTSALEVDDYVRSLMDKRAEKEKEYDAFLEDVRTYCDNYQNKKNKRKLKNN